MSPGDATTADSGAPQGRLAIAMIHEVFPGDDGPERLAALLTRAREAGAELAVLPELPLDPWVPAGRAPRAADAEPPLGPRHRALADCARATGIAVLGGAIVHDPASDRRFNRALLFDARGELLGAYDKLHVPYEDGFWEAAHYGDGDQPPQVIDGLGLRLGVQICSDLFRPEGCHLLGAMGAEAILAPRATPDLSYERWRSVIRANAVASGCYIISVNRPRPERAVLLGGPSLLVTPDGNVRVESVDPVRVVVLERAAIADARRSYPGYLPIRSDIYSRGWSQQKPLDRRPAPKDPPDPQAGS